MLMLVFNLLVSSMLGRFAKADSIQISSATPVVAFTLPCKLPSFDHV